MKCKMLFAPALLTVLFLSSTTFAQVEEPTTEKKVTVKVKVTENGKTTETTKEITVNDEEQLNKVLDNLDILEQIELDGKNGEQLEITIRKDDEGDVFRRIEVEVAENMEREMKRFEHMAARFAETETKPLLGVYGQSTQTEEEEQNNGQALGSYVTKVIEGSGAEAAGIQTGDIITAIDGQIVNGQDHLAEMIGTHQPEDKVQVTYLRDGAEKTIEATIGKKEVRTYKHCKPNPDCMTMEQCKERIHKRKEEMHQRMEELQNRAFLGVIGDTEDGETANGARIGSVVENSAAEQMGLQEGDIVTKVNDRSISNFEDLGKAIRSFESGQEATIEYIRGEETEIASGTLKSRKEMHCDMSKFDHASKEVTITIQVEDVTPAEAATLKENANVDVTKENDLQFSKLEFAPNPNDGKFTLNFTPAERGETSIRLFDLSGKEVFTDKVMVEEDYSNAVDISEEPSGVYFLIITQNGKQFSKKIVKN